MRSIFTNQHRQQVKARHVVECRHGAISEPHCGQVIWVIKTIKEHNTNTGQEASGGR